MSDSKQQIVMLPDEFAQPALAELKNEIDKVFSTQAYVQLDAASVERIDSAALQFLVAFSQCDLAHVPCIANMGKALVVALGDIGVGNDEIEHLYGGTVITVENAA